MKKIGFIGLGHMGLPMALNLLNAGEKLWIYDLNPQTLEEAITAGATLTSTAIEAATGRDIVITVLPGSTQVHDVYLGKFGLLEQIQEPTLFIECSTIDITTCRALHTAANQHGHRFVDAPMSGGIMGAKNATLTFMVGGTEPHFQESLPLLQAMGKNIFHAGDATHGIAAKICNNLMLGIHMIATSEAFILAQALGLDPKKLYEISSVSSGSSWSLNVYCPAPGVLPQSPASNNYKAGFTAAMMLKDLNLATTAATEIKPSLPMTHTAKEIYKTFCDVDGQLDFSGILCYLETLASK